MYRVPVERNDRVESFQIVTILVLVTYPRSAVSPARRPRPSAPDCCTSTLTNTFSNSFSLALDASFSPARPLRIPDPRDTGQHTASCSYAVREIELSFGGHFVQNLTFAFLRVCERSPVLVDCRPKNCRSDVKIQCRIVVLTRKRRPGK